MEMNGPGKGFSRRQEKSLLRIAAQITRSAFDSPQRIGCPKSQTLKLLAQRSPSAGESPDLIDHIATCSPCFIEYSRYRTAHKRRVAILFSIASSALLALCFLLVRARILPTGQTPALQGEAARGAAPLERVLDLRLSGIPRGEAPEAKDGQIPRLPRGRLTLSVYLPTGSESGIYEIALANAAGESLVTGSGEAMLQNYIQVLPVSLDLTKFPAGRYELRIRGGPAVQWNSYVIVIE
jgi:hypothetical protein